MKRILKIVMAILLVICLFDMPYGYYNLIRFIAMIVFSYFSYSYFKDSRPALGFSFAALALLFQPFVKIALGKDIWNVVDVV